MTTIERLEDLEEDLLSRAFLFEHPAAYREAVELALRAVRTMLEGRREIAYA